MVNVQDRQPLSMSVLRWIPVLLPKPSLPETVVISFDIRSVSHRPLSSHAPFVIH